MAAIRDRRVRPRLPDGRRPRVPGGEAEESHLDDGGEPEEIGGLGVYICYEAADGNVTERRITCRKLVRSGENIYVHAWCHEAEAPRCFRLDRIFEMVDPSTGEVLEGESDIRAFFARYRAIEEASPEMKAALTILTFLAACDGEMHPLEVDALHDFVAHHVARFGGDEGTLETARRLLATLAPEYRDVERALAIIERSRMGRQVAAHLIHWIDTVVAADGVLHEAEMAELIDWLQAVKDRAG